MLKELSWQLKETEQELQEHEKGNRNYKQEPGRNEEYKINIWNKNTWEGITSSLDEAEDRISEWEDKVEKNTQKEQEKEETQKEWRGGKGAVRQCEM